MLQLQFCTLCMVLYLLGRNLPLYMFICILSLKDLVVKGIVYLHFSYE